MARTNRQDEMAQVYRYAHIYAGARGAAAKQMSGRKRQEGHEAQEMVARDGSAVSESAMRLQRRRRAVREDGR